MEETKVEEGDEECLVGGPAILSWATREGLRKRVIFE